MGRTQQCGAKGLKRQKNTEMHCIKLYLASKLTEFQTWFKMCFRIGCIIFTKSSLKWSRSTSYIECNCNVRLCLIINSEIERPTGSNNLVVSRKDRVHLVFSTYGFPTSSPPWIWYLCVCVFIFVYICVFVFVYLCICISCTAPPPSAAKWHLLSDENYITDQDLDDDDVEQCGK